MRHEATAEATPSGLAGLPSRWVRWGAWASALGPAFIGLLRVGGEPRWERDLETVRALGLVQIGAEGIVSSSLSAALAWLPLGGKLLRLALFGPVLLAVAGWLSYRIALQLWGRQRFGGGLEVLTATAAAWCAVLSASWQQSLAGASGPVMASVLLLLGILASQLGPSRRSLAVGLLMGLTLAECREAALLQAAVWLAAGLARWSLPTGRQLWVLFGSATASLVVCLLPSLLEPWSLGEGTRLGLELRVEHLNAVASTPGHELGAYFWAAAAVGALSVVLRRQHQRMGVPLLVGLGVAWLLSTREAQLFGTAIIALLSGLGLLTMLRWVARSGLPFRQTSLALGGLVHLCALLILLEDARQLLSVQPRATRRWSEEAFDRLPVNSLLLTSSPSAAWRLWAARLATGVRPDVVLVPSALLTHGSLASELLRIEPALHRVIRDLAAQGRISEYALSELADARPLRVELHVRWDEGLLSHLVGDGLWFRFAPHPMGRSDRAQGLSTVAQAARRVWRAAGPAGLVDRATASRLREDLMGHALVSAALGEGASARRVLRQLRRMAPDDSRVLRLQQEVARRPRGVSNVARFAQEAAMDDAVPR